MPDVLQLDLHFAGPSIQARPTYFWSGSNNPGEIAALGKHGHDLGVSVNAIDKDGRSIAALAALAGSTRVSVNVAQNGSGNPILMLGSSRDQLPTGDVEVAAGGRRFLFGFRKIAVNVARSINNGANLLADLLRGMLGDDAGARGKGHKVTLERVGDGWRMTDADIEAVKASSSKCFVDSGAFGEVSFNAPHVCTKKQKLCRAGECIGAGNFPFPAAAPFTWVDVHPIDHAEWTRRLNSYERIAKALGPQCYLVAPDKVGDQQETLRRLTRYADRIRQFRAMGANIIVPIQRGDIEGAEFDRQCSAILGFSDYVRGIPSKKAAATTEEIAALSSSLPADARIHLLGLGPYGDRYAEVIAAVNRAPELVFCDSVRIPALVGRTNGPNKGPRILTILTDAAMRHFGLTIGKKNNVPNAARVKFHALDAYFTSHFEGLPNA